MTSYLQLIVSYIPEKQVNLVAKSSEALQSESMAYHQWLSH